jgi:hypothetical protein
MKNASKVLFFLSPLFLFFPYFFYSAVVSVDLWWGFRLWVGFMGFGYYMFLISQIAYYACRLPAAYAAAGVLVFGLFFLSMTAPPLIILALAGLFATLAVALFFGVRSGVFYHSWLVAVIWLILWNIVAGVLALPANLVFKEEGVWLWWEKPPAHPAHALAVGAAGMAATWILGRVRKLVRSTCQKATPPAGAR